MDEARAPTQPPLVVHVIHRLAVGGLENGLVNLINQMPPERYRHAIVCMTEATDFRARIRRDDVEIVELHKRPGQDFSVYARFWKVLRRLRPAVVHTRNLGTLEMQLVAWLLRVRGRMHGEHGRDTSDLDGSNRKYLALRRGFRPLLHAYTTVSRDLRDWLIERVAVEPARIRQIYNGVDTERFSPAGPVAALPNDFAASGSVIFGTVGRLQGEKDQLTLVRAFARLVADRPPEAVEPRLVLVGDGPLRAEVERLIDAQGLREKVWLAGAREDVPDLFRALDVFVLPSLTEGISNTILEAMASALPVLATNVGGNPELVEPGVSGELVPSNDPPAMAAAMRAYLDDPARRRAHGAAGRERVLECFSMASMSDTYAQAYDRVLGGPGQTQNS